MNTRKVSGHDLATRENAFATYRDMGLSRSYTRLEKVLRAGPTPVNINTIKKWAKQHDWQGRCKAFDAQRALAEKTVLSTDFNRLDSLLLSAHLALTKALESSPTVNTPQEFKALVDAARIALLLADKIEERQGRQRAQDPKEVRENMWSVIDAIEDRVRNYPKIPDSLKEKFRVNTSIELRTEDEAAAGGEPEAAVPEQALVADTGSAAEPGVPDSDQHLVPGVDSDEDRRAGAASVPEIAHGGSVAGKPLSMEQRLALRRAGPGV